MARHFTAASSDYIDAGTGVRGTDLKGIAVMGWFNLDDTAADYHLVARWNNANANSQWLLHTNTVGGHYVLTFSCLSSGLAGFGQNGATVLTSGTWYHLAALYDNHTIWVYVNGAIDGTSVPGQQLNDNVGTTPVQIGRSVDGGFLNGSAAEVSLSLINTTVEAASKLQRVTVSCAQGASPSDVEGMYNTDHMEYWPILGDSPEPSYTPTHHAATVHGTTVVNHPGVRSITSFRGA